MNSFTFDTSDYYHYTYDNNSLNYSVSPLASMELYSEFVCLSAT